jgi:hypothetical protein
MLWDKNSSLRPTNNFSKKFVHKRGQDGNKLSMTSSSEKGLCPLKEHLIVSPLSIQTNIKPSQKELSMDERTSLFLPN